MNTIKKVGMGLLIIIAIPLIVALFVPKDFSYEKSITINAPVDSVWVNANSLTALDKWSPWNDHDPNMKKEMTGMDGTIGAKQSWESGIVGSGSQTIAKVEKPLLFETELNFTKPNESNGKAYVKLIPEGASTNATWGMTGSISYPFNLMNLFMDMEKNMGKDWDNGLSKLKMLSEK
ncbi:MAG: SRPBCC family protein [Paludibacter sp.]|nr:SRPBCC family protein [Paludibacter sp.]